MAYPLSIFFLILLSIYSFTVIEKVQCSIKFSLDGVDDQNCKGLDKNLDLINDGIFALISLMTFWSFARLIWSDPGFIKHGVDYNPEKLSSNDLTYWKYVTRHRFDTQY
jgi:hypothetical protein